MAAQTTLNFAFWNNVPWTESHQMLNNDSTPVDLTGASIEMQFRVSPFSDDVAIEISTANGRIVIVTPSTGTWQFNVSHLDALQVVAQTYFQDMVVTLPDGTVFTSTSGTAVITQGITRSIFPWQGLADPTG